VSYVALKLSNIPNLLTVLRMLLVVPIVWLLLQERFGETLILFMIAGATDGIDGLLAKQFSWTSYSRTPYPTAERLIKVP
jgi:cardiolipin synthase